MNKITLRTCLAFIICFVLFQNLSFAQNSFTGYDVFVIAGQSNAVGVGAGPYVDVLKSKSLDAKIFQLGRYGTDNKKIIPGQDVLQHFSYTPRTTTIGFGMAFARRYARWMDKNRKVLLIPAAMGGTSVLQWLGELPLTTRATDSLMNDLKFRLKLAMDAKDFGRPLPYK